MKQALPIKLTSGFKKTVLFGGLFLGLTNLVAYAAPSSYDYRSFKNGNWNDPTTWSVRAKGATSGAFVQLASTATADIPDATAGTISIDHIITVSNDIEADQITITGQLTMEDKLSIPNGATLGITLNGGVLEVSNGSLFLNNNIITGNGEILINPTSTLAVGSAGGIDDVGISGSIQTSGEKVFSPGATYIYNGTTTQFTGDGLPLGANLIIDNAAGVSLSAPIEVASLTLSHGVLTTSNTNLLTIQAGGSIISSEPNSFVNGPLARRANTATTLFFPIGKNGNKRSFELTIVSTSGLDTYIAEQFDSPYVPQSTTLPADVTHISKVRYFTISKSENANTTARLKLTYSSDDMVTDPSKLTIVKYSGGIAEDLFAYASGNEITTGNFTTFSDFVLANKTGGNNPLPVELLNFAAKARENAIGLTWETASEKNSSHFEIERSQDARSFERIGQVKAAGHSQSLKRYAFEDKNPVKGTAYYRLKQVDLDGTVAYSKIESVNNSQLKTEISLYPNPTTGIITINLSESHGAELKLLSILGQVVLSKKVTNAKSTELNLQHLPAGSYQLQISTGNDLVFKKILKSDI